MTLFLTSVTAGAYNVRWMIDNPENIKVTTNAGYGRVLEIVNDMSTVEDADNPLLIEGVNGATITSLSLNMQEVSPAGDGAYRIGITQNSMIQITTQGGSGTQTVSPYFFIMADDNNSASAIITYGDGQQVTNGMQATVDVNTEFTITPAPAYEITNVESFNRGPVRNNGDGTYTYTATVEGDYVYVYTKGNGTKFTVNIDFAQNVNVFTGISSTETETPCTVYSGANQLNVPADQDYIQFYATDGASIVSITRNGEPVSGAGYRPWRAMLAAGDVFDVTTQGKPVTVKFSALENQAALENYTFTSGGTELSLSGMSATADLHLGDVVTVAPKGATKFNYVYGSGIQTIDSNTFRITKEDCEVWVSGEKATGVSINVSDAAQIVVRQSNGYGEAVTLQTGLNTFDLAALGSPLQITAAQGCEIISVTLDGTPLTRQNNGSYLANLTEGCYIDIKSREIPSDVAVTFMCLTPGFYEGVEVTVNGEAKTLGTDVANLTVPFEAVVNIKAKFGYVLTDVTSESGFAITSEEGVFQFVADRAGSVTLFGNKIEAGENQAILSLSADNAGVNFYEYSGETLVQILTTENVNVVTKGNTLRMRLFTSNLFIGNVTVNGTPLTIGKDARVVDYTIEGDADIAVETYSKVDVSVYDVADPVNHSFIGKLYIKVGDELLKNYSAAVGETITLVSETAAGYQLDYIKRIYPESDVEYGDTYTISEADLENNLVIFQGVYSVSSETPSYVIRCNQTWVDNELVGYVLIDNNGTEVKELRFLEGDEVHLNAYARDDYETVRFMLWRDNSVTLSNPYIVNGADADTEGVIDITAEFRPMGSGIGEVSVNGAISYDRALGQLTADGTIRVYNTTGRLILTSDGGTLSVQTLPAGIYIAVTDNGTLKFAK